MADLKEKNNVVLVAAITQQLEAYEQKVRGYRTVLKGIVEGLATFGFDDPDEPVSGADLTDYISNLYPAIKAFVNEFPPSEEDK